MKIKQISLVTFLAGALFSITGVIVPFIVLQNYTSQSGATGMVGGADTPTYKFIVFRLLNGWPFAAILFGITLIASALFCLIFSKTVKKNCNLKTTALSLGLSTVGALGLSCVSLWSSITSFGEMSRYPIEYPVSILLGIASFFGFMILTALYLKTRRKNWYVKGFLIDILTGIIYLPAFFFGFSYLYQLIA